ncbi:hypothetical protein N7481_008644 [Penicillium waksmanii]|uniref:uncharacterized protein n=1 Tax=Penicillium waksmanii TaxID=69791 RepID=UPI002548F929|nr:uncharacterized protein N7481_008644 [Penicillium waksmanii]KAJ5974937.1 hypothetical protein N7481_008644 [Penicillium waksmanii]
MQHHRKPQRHRNNIPQQHTTHGTILHGPFLPRQHSDLHGSDSDSTCLALLGSSTLARFTRFDLSKAPIPMQHPHHQMRH